MSGEAREVRLTAQAKRDLPDIFVWTAGNFGPEQERIYSRTIADVLFEFGQGPGLVGVKPRDDISKGLYSLHVARSKRRGRHLIVFRTTAAAERIIEVLRILHDAIDMARHVETDE